MFVISYVTLTIEPNKHHSILIRLYYIYSSLNVFICPTLLQYLFVFFIFVSSIYYHVYHRRLDLWLNYFSFLIFVCERFLHYIIKLYSICIPVFELLSFFLYTEEKASFYKKFGTFSGRHVGIMRSKDLIEGAWSFGEHTFAVFSQSSKFNLKLKMRKKGWKL